MKHRNQFFFIIIDAALSLVSIFLAVWLRFEGLIPEAYWRQLPVYYPIAAVTVVAAGLAFGTYRSVLQYMGFADAFRQTAAAVSSAAVFLIVKYTRLYPVSGSITVIYFGILLIFTIAVRLIPRFRHWLRTRNHPGARRTMVIGAGDTGAMVIKRLEESMDDSLYPVVAVDDDPAKVHMRVAGVTVAARINQIPRVARKYRVEEAILAIPSLDIAAITDIHHKCASAGIKLRLFRTAVDMESFIAGDERALKQIDIGDLLFRDSIRLDKELIFRCLKGKTVLVTGGAGSIGSEICRQALANGCGKLVIFDLNENGLFLINEELRLLYPGEKYELCLGDLRDEARIEQIFEAHKPQLVFHAAAHKHVPMTELNPFEAVRNNIGGTENLINACLHNRAERFILISTDKAVNPANIMGATKRVAELLVQSMKGSDCKMAAVRFGNVLGSSGSVISTFQRQIERGGPLTLTHPDMERYFITIPEAVSLVMVAGTLAEGGEIFVLEMGKPVKIYDLAREMIRLSGREPDKDIKIEITGIRPGDKLTEEIVLGSEIMEQTIQEKLYVIKGEELDKDRFIKNFFGIELAAQGRDPDRLREALMETVKTFS
ncbi:MAG: polysaccharide biosynthesis protein [Clostridiales bacterium]|nr:polysaccharide biosynthesis protein [Clostridiales bacterium]